MIPIKRTVKNVHKLLSTLCDAKYRANVGAFILGNLDFDAWSDATDGDTNNGSGVDGESSLRNTGFKKSHTTFSQTLRALFFLTTSSAFIFFIPHLLISAVTSRSGIYNIQNSLRFSQYT